MTANLVIEEVPDVFTASKVRLSTKTQWIAAAEVFLLEVLLGANFGWISPFLGKLSRPDSPFQATKEQISWVASLVSMSRVIAIISGSVTTNYFGTKKSLYVCGFYYLAAWACLICAKSINMIYINQFCCGLSMGTLWTIYPLYLGEIADPSIRGSVITFVTNGFSVGLLYGNLMGSQVESWIFGVVNLILSGIFLLTFYFFPSTPQYLINCNKLEDAENALKVYNDGADVKEEFAKLQKFINSSPRISFLESVRKLMDPVNRKTFIMINVVYSLVQFSGTYNIVEYLEVIIMAGKLEVMLPSTLVTIMSAITIPSSLVAVAYGDKFGRVTMLLFSCVVFCIAFVGWGLSFHLLELGFSPSQVQWLLLTSALVYRINMTAGMNPIVPVLISEVFAPNVKSISACLCNITSSFCTFISIKNFQLMVDHMTYKYLFYFYAGLILAVGIYSVLCIPETKGKSLQEIQDILSKSNVGKTKNVSRQVYVNSVCEQTINGDENNTK